VPQKVARNEYFLYTLDMEKQNIAHLLTVSFITLCTGYLLWVTTTSSPQVETYTYWSEKIIDAEYDLVAYRQPSSDRETTRLAFVDTWLREHGAADEEVIFDTIKEIDNEVSLLLRTEPSETWTSLLFDVQWVDQESGEYMIIVYVDGREYTTVMDTSDVLLPEDFTGRIRADLVDADKLLLISAWKPVQAYADIF